MAVAQQEGRPNIIILYADDLGWNDISGEIPTGGNGSKNHQTPHIDNLSTESMSFFYAYMQPNCAPSRAAMISGQYPTRNGVYNVGSLDRFGKGVDESNTRILPPVQRGTILPETITFAETLKLAGYKTYVFGKVHGWGKEDLAKYHGFDVDLSINKKIKEIEGSNYTAVKDGEGNWVFENPEYNIYALPYSIEYVKKNLSIVENGNAPSQLIGKPKHFTDALTDAVLDQISQVSRNNPFMMWVNFHAIHSAVVGREDLNEKYKKRKGLDSRHDVVDYAALTEHLDQSIGRILQALDDPNGDGKTDDSIVKNTVVIFTSDNGGVTGKHSNAPLRSGKGTFYEGGIRVPLMVRYPEKINPGLNKTEIIHAVDFFPTLADIAGANLPAPQSHMLDGESFWPILTDSKSELERDAIYYHFPGYMDDRLEPSSMIIKKISGTRFKLIYSYEKETYELYDLDKDISEEKNLLQFNPSKNHMDLAENLRTDLNNWLKHQNPPKMKYKNGGSVGLPPSINGINQTIF